MVLIGLVAAITIHEFAHAWVADYLGDPTPRSQGRVTLDPRAHLDPLGTIAILLTRFGWGKPVQFDPYNLEDPIRDTALIGLAGPVSNIFLASGLAAIRLVGVLPEIVNMALVPIIVINVILAFFNLIPVHPLDGSKILLALLPADTAREYEMIMHQYGLFILILMIIPLNGTSIVSQLIGPAINAVLMVLQVPLL